MFRTNIAVVAGLALLSVLASPKADANSAGRLKAQAACVMCHGQNGIAPMPSAPNLAGQQELYLVEQLKHYRSGKRQHEVMSVIAKPLSDGDIEALAAWYASMKLTVEVPH